jgi:hypothetical protein
MNDLMRQAVRRGPQCPELPQLLDAMDQDPATPVRREMEAHLHSCASCQTEWKLFQEFQAADVQQEERESVEYIVRKVAANRPPLPALPPKPRFWQQLLKPAWIGASVVALAALVMAIGLTSQWRARHTSIVDDGGSSVLRSQTIEITTPLHDLNEVPRDLTWTPVPGATSYDVLFTEVDGTRIFYTKITTPSLLLPSNITTLLAQGRTLILSITAGDRAEREIARSQSERIRIRTK